MKDLLERNISFLKLSDNVNKALKENDIKTVNELWHLTRKDLKKMGLSDKEITSIIIKMELNALDLGGKTY